jgi:hypothetical protein
VVSDSGLQQQQQVPQKKKKQGSVLQEASAHLEDLISDPKHAAEVVEAELKAAAAEAEAALEQAKAGANAAVKSAIKKASPTPRQQFILIRWAQKAAGALVGVATTAFLLFYQWVVEPAPPHSLRVKAFAALTQVGRKSAGSAIVVVEWLGVAFSFDAICARAVCCSTSGWWSPHRYTGLRVTAFAVLTQVGRQWRSSCFLHLD